MHDPRRWTRMLRGDLVSWTREGNKMVGVVLDVYPANIYEKEVCRIIADGSVYTVDSIYLALHNKDLEDAQLHDGLPGRVEDTGLK